MKSKVQHNAGTSALTNALFFTPVTVEMTVVTHSLYFCSHFEGVLAIRINARNRHGIRFRLRQKKKKDNLLCSIINIFSVTSKPIYIVQLMYSECFDGRSFYDNETSLKIGHSGIQQAQSA